MAKSDAELIAGSSRDPGLFAGLFDRHYGAIASFLRRRLERSLADELASEVFWRAFARAGRVVEVERGFDEVDARLDDAAPLGGVITRAGAGGAAAEARVPSSIGPRQRAAMRQQSRPRPGGDPNARYRIRRPISAVS